MSNTSKKIKNKCRKSITPLVQQFKKDASIEENESVGIYGESGRVSGFVKGRTVEELRLATLSIIHVQKIKKLNAENQALPPLCRH
mmetsp:Transcript_2536/g.5463  ORF Transcript_2536/g.5463 Transcript_2536/m.5463 type:complete len:86 (-) Transcript_2536:41-298(-)